MPRLEAVSKRYGRGRWILQDVDVDIPAGSVVAFAGGNGSGKSTLLRMVVGLSKPTRGAVTGRPAVVSYVPDRFSPDERLSALTYLTHMGRIRGLDTRTASSRAHCLLDRLALVGGKGAELRTLSKGNAQHHRRTGVGGPAAPPRRFLPAGRAGAARGLRGEGQWAQGAPVNRGASAPRATADRSEPMAMPMAR